jgi:hypothetical protein
MRNKGQVGAEHLRIRAEVPHTGFLILHLREYAAWQVRVNGRLLAFEANPVLTPLPHRDDGMMAVPVPQGHVEVAIDWATTRDVIIGRWLSAIFLILLAALYIAERRASSHTDPVLTSAR